ncbi:MAG: UvrD-helicase domain-containing protein [Deferribacteraceae bacterium]|jgi:DNA helicase-2/ATP-dependent DNA helicase PcrA|nr:UvrD-helicase domain-containing protein [Deferribacteraceae bacterium]
MENKDKLLSQLNEKQAEAVTCTDGPLLVLAGAGAGKTRVIVYRIAYLIQVCGIKPWNILAVTFTNKAAGEMKSRLTQLVGADARDVWMGTFHGFGLSILRRYSGKIASGENFSVLDEDDRLAAIRNILKLLDIDPKEYPPKRYLHLISKFKNSAAYVENIQPEEVVYKFRAVFSAYEDELRRQKMVDFDDMLSLSLRLFLQNPDILAFYRERCQYILVDEYQDTNVIQFNFLRTLAGEDGNLCVVGDDDQSIYGWRGADVGNILYFDSHFKGVTEIKLVDNYRSAPEILDAANRLIRKNSARRGKDLIPCSDRTGVVARYKTEDERNETEVTANIIEKYIKEGIPATEIAILYRTNAQSRNFEATLSRRGIAYKVVGGLGFYQRREIKDILSYLRLYENRFDEMSFYRAAKNPPKKIGDMLTEKVTTLASSHHTDLINASEQLIPLLPPHQSSGLILICNLMRHLDTLKNIPDKINAVIEQVGYKEYLSRTEEPEEAKSRTENLYELYNAAAAFEEALPDGSLSDFLATATLASASDEAVRDTVSLMTIHAAKGLEFEAVFLTGLEEGIFPLADQDGNNNLEEERRLCYVGGTRAKKYLNLTHTELRMIRGSRHIMKSSRFLEEFLSTETTIKPETNEGIFTPSDGSFRKGQLVCHESLGTGIVMQVHGTGDSAKVDVLFKKGGLKKLVARFIKAV